MENGYCTNSKGSRTNSGGRSTDRQRSSASSDDVVRICNCGKEVVVRTSWTSTNLGRRFRGCPGSSAEVRYCGTFQWVDPPICQRSKDIIPGLLKRLTLYENAMKRANECIEAEQKKRQRLQMFCYVTVAIWLVTVAVAVKSFMG